jgi:putative copper resistance protein D
MLNALLVGSRLMQFAGALVLLGSSLFYAYGREAVVLPLPVLKRRQWSRRRVLAISALAAAIGTVLWVMASTALFSGEPTDAINPPAVWLVFSETRFGRACLWRVGLLLISLAVSFSIAGLKSLWILQAVLATLVIATFAWTGHGAMDSGWPGAIHVAGDVLHLWVAGVWFGALVPLGMLVFGALRSDESADARAACHGLERFSAIGSAVIAVLILSGLMNSWFLIGVANWPASLTTSYGVALLIKLALFALMLGLATVNRFRLVPRLRHALQDQQDRGTSASLHALTTNLSIEIALAALVLLAVGVLGTLPPPISGE